ncbi:ChrR family anti-sigma-E factor [Rhodobaculum claviforme]|uniref:Transcriptional regulator n=1 Tax=Rhodobaculum claviforme TaxID=1549854 RepID=A0A934TJU8_9RHOB|nr:ChrR family anti-sigma-E factor [Rhodobaculum claviforme]MBK5927424.1 transcriptional regulator [Rhodobaculum claviforme]
MTIRHHLSDELLLAYAAGTLPEAFDLVVATHVSLCDECRARLGALEAVGGAVLDDTPAAPVADGSLEATLRMIRDRGKDPIVARPPAGVFPAPLRAYVGGDLEAVRWRPLGGGVKQAILPAARGATVRLMHIPAGVAMPDHGHRGLELTQVLQGAFFDKDDEFYRGDIEIATEETQHTPRAGADQHCLCLTATDAPLRFSTMLPRLAQPFFRI